MFCYWRQAATRCPLFLSVKSLFCICLWCFFINIELLDLRLNISVKGLLPELLSFPDWVILNTGVSKLDNTSIQFLKIPTKSWLVTVHLDGYVSGLRWTVKVQPWFLIVKSNNHLLCRKLLLEVKALQLKLCYSYLHHPTNKSITQNCSI